MNKIRLALAGTMTLGVAFVILQGLNSYAEMDAKHHNAALDDGQTPNKCSVVTVDVASTSSLNRKVEVVTAYVEPIVPNAVWDEATVKACWAQVGPPAPYPEVNQYRVSQLIKVAQAAHMPTPSNGEELLKTIYALTITNIDDSPILAIIGSVTNESLCELLLWGVTNFHLASLEIPMGNKVQRHWVYSKCDASITGLRRIGTPAVIDRLNKLLRQLQKEGHPIYEPQDVIDPAKYPVEARDWLLNYPDPMVRYNMLEEWTKSGRPETPEVLDEFCKRVRDMPDDFYLWKGEDAAAGRKRMIKNVKNSRDEYVRRYKRWVDDGKKENFNSGSYSDPDDM